jgi:preprotein translocase subunit SecY
VQNENEKEHVLKYKLAYSGIILLVYIVGKNIPLYKIDLSAYQQASVGVEDLLVQTIGGDFIRSSILALGVFPSMISALLVQVILALRGLFTKAKVSPRKSQRMTVAMTFAVAAFQAVTRLPELKFVVTGGMLPVARAVAGVEMVTGAIFIMWLSDRNGKYGISGRMVFVTVNILERIWMTLLGHPIQKLAVPLAAAALMMLVILIMENTEKRVPVQRISIHNIYGDKNYLAIKFNPVGIMPMMFATAVFMLPQLLVSLLGYLFPQQSGISWCQENLSLTKPFGIFIYIVCEYLLTIGFSLLMISPRDITEQFLKSGDSIVDLRAGRDTRRYLGRVIWRISFLSATVMGACIAAPLILQLRGDIDSTLVMLPTSMMMLMGFSCNMYREVSTLHSYDSCRPLF